MLQHLAVTGLLWGGAVMPRAAHAGLWLLSGSDVNTLVVGNNCCTVRASLLEVQL